MPPKAKITKEMIVEEAFQIARTQGADKITARSIAQRLKCSTQPVLYYFATVEEIKEAVYQRADAYHTRFLMGTEGGGDGMLGIGLRYVRFAAEERNLFHLLFQPGSVFGSQPERSGFVGRTEPHYSGTAAGDRSDGGRGQRDFFYAVRFRSRLCQPAGKQRNEAGRRSIDIVPEKSVFWCHICGKGD